MAREKESPIVEQQRKEFHDAGLLDQRYADEMEGHIAQSERNIEKAIEGLKHLSEEAGLERTPGEVAVSGAYKASSVKQVPPQDRLILPS